MASQKSRSGSSYDNGSKLLPKFKDCQFDCLKKKDPGDLRKWMMLLSSIVRIHPHQDQPAGSELENFLDSKFGRHQKRNTTRPAFLLRHDFEDPDSDDDGIDLTSADDQRGDTISETTESALSAPPRISPSRASPQTGITHRDLLHLPVINYRDLSPAAKELDRMLFQNILAMVNGEYFDLISDLQGKDARYTVAMYAFHQHA